MTKPIFDISWVTPDSFDIKRLSIEKIENRYKFMYKYNDNKDASEFRLTCPRTEEAYMHVSELSPNMYKGVPTGRNKCSIRLNAENGHHYDVMAVINKCGEKFQKKIGKSISSSALYIKDEQNAILYCNMIEDSDDIYTPFYTDSEQLDAKNVGQFLGRPALTFSVTEKCNLKACISQAYVYKITPNFPLAYRD